MKFAAIHANVTIHPATRLCKLFGASSSGYHDWLSRADHRLVRSKAEQKLVRTIEAVHVGSNKNYGSPPIADRLRGLGFEISDSTVARCMRKHDIRSRVKKKFKVTTTSDHKLPVAPNLLMQDFRAYRPDQIWMSDITYVDTAEGTLYVCGIIDLFSKRIVGWHAMHAMPQELVITAYIRARRNRRPKYELIFHSDQGSQYASKGFRTILGQDAVMQSMSRRGNCWDSAPIESFWARLKTECVYWYKFATRQDALATIAEWVERYNNARAHSSNDYATPIEFEMAFAKVSGNV